MPEFGLQNGKMGGAVTTKKPNPKVELNSFFYFSCKLY